MLGTEMRPSSAISFEPGLERGVPWGRDLITFMTSAAGYMMRTLQKPRKNKPSKRQVNHRRFLHNMIQRKFAETEAANHQVASALLSVDTVSQRQSEAKWTYKLEPEKSLKKATTVFGEAKTKHLDDNNDTKIVPNESSVASKSLNNLVGKANEIREDGEQVEPSSESSPQQITNFTSEREQIQWAFDELSDLTPITNLIVEDNVFTLLESIERIPENSYVPMPNSPGGEQQQQQYLGLTLFDLSPTSPVSPLSLNSCDFEVQIRPDNGHISQIQHTKESFQMDLMENLELLDSDEYLQKINQMDMAAVWDIHIEEDLSCFQDNLSFFNTSHTDFAMDKQATCGDGDICGELQQITTLLENSVKNMNVENDLRSNITYSLAHCGSSGHQEQTKQAGETIDCCINQPEISTAVSKEGQYAHHLSHYNHASSEVKDHYYTLTDEEKKMIESGYILNPNLAHSNTVNLMSSIMAHCYGFDVPLQANSNCIGDLSSISNDGDNQSIPCFEGVAQSFPAPHQNPPPHPVSTPPLNDDWLFSNIATEVDFNSMVKSYGHTYC